MPVADGLGLYEDENVTPAGPGAGQNGPEQVIDGVQRRARALAFQYCDLLREARTSSAVSPRERKKTRPAATMERANSNTSPPL
jgi:hypothetical protein